MCLIYRFIIHYYCIIIIHCIIIYRFIIHYMCIYNRWRGVWYNLQLFKKYVIFLNFKLFILYWGVVVQSLSHIWLWDPRDYSTPGLPVPHCWGIQLINKVVVVPGEQQMDSALHIHVSILPETLLPSSLVHNIEQSSMCYTIGLCWLSILNITVYAWPFQSP